ASPSRFKASGNKGNARRARRHASQRVPQFYYRYATRVPREAHAGQKRLGFCNAQANSLIVRKTKIICTLGPATEKTETLRQLIQKGTDVFRLNMSHATHEWVRN